MSNDALNYVWKHSRSQHMARLVLLSIADRADNQGHAFCSAEDLCRRVNGDRSTVFRALGALRQSGELVVEDTRGPGGCNRYVIPGVAETGGVRRLASGKSPPPPSQNATGESRELQTPDGRKTPPIPSLNPSWNPHEREEMLTLDAAIAMFEPEFPDKPVRRSLSKMKLEFRRALTPSACREWLQREREAKKVKTVRTSSWDEAAPAAVGQSTVDSPPPPEPSTRSLTSSGVQSMELEFINPAEIDRERFAEFVAKCHYQHIASWTPYSAPQAVLRQFLNSNTVN